MKIGVQKKSFRGHILYTIVDPSKKCVFAKFRDQIKNELE